MRKLAMAHSIAMNVLLAHDAAELALAGIANQCGKLPPGNRHSFMDYFPPLKTCIPKAKSPEMAILTSSIEFGLISNIKVYSPDPQQWSRVGERVYEYVSAWCSKYLKVNFDALDQSVLLNDHDAKLHYDKAKKHFASQEYKEVLEEVAETLRITFDKKPALSGISIGKSSAEDAIRLAAFGVQANDFIRLQQFLPEVRSQSDGLTKFMWSQNDYGHPGNWHEEAAQFCLNTALNIAVKLQTAAWIPGPVRFHALYEYKVEAIKDDVQIWNLPRDKEYTLDLSGHGSTEN